MVQWNGRFNLRKCLRPFAEYVEIESHPSLHMWTSKVICKHSTNVSHLICLTLEQSHEIDPR